MKTLMCLFTVTITLFACKKEPFDMHHPDVDEFISVVKSGHYFEEVGFELPDFHMNQIERLLHYAKDTSVIQEFPTHPLSSMYTSPKILSECLLWTIDGIRFSSKYPSMEPVMRDTLKFSEEEGFKRVSGQELVLITNLYNEWFEEYKNNPTENVRTKDILENTTYRW